LKQLSDPAAVWPGAFERSEHPPQTGMLRAADGRDQRVETIPRPLGHDGREAGRAKEPDLDADARQSNLPLQLTADTGAPTGGGLTSNGVAIVERSRSPSLSASAPMTISASCSVAA
jgi:hypothetical protein